MTSRPVDGKALEMPPASSRKGNFLSEIIETDLAEGKNQGRVVTRFPPEPNGFLHIGHAKSIVLNFGVAQQYGGECHLRFDDTNPTTEDPVYVEAIQRDVRWLGYDWGRHLYYASDFFQQMYECALRLIREGKAYVDSQSVEQIREQRGTFERMGTNSPFRARSVEENLDLFQKMRRGEFEDGACVLRAKIDMSHPNLLMRDPLLYRIRHAPHHRTGDQWPIYPMYDYAHPLEDAFEGVTHSFCTLEFESNRELYDWVLDKLGPWNPRPRQYEFARLALGYTVMSKRKLLELVTERRVSGWDDPRMPTIAGMRRRGVTPQALREFADLIGVAKNNSIVDLGKLEFAIRSDLEARALRGMAVLNPLKVTIANWPKGRVEALEIPWWPDEPGKAGVRTVSFGGTIFIEQEDFSQDPPKDWKRLAPGRYVRLIGAFVIRCDEVILGPSGQIEELRCTYDPNSKGGHAAKGQKISGTLHWADAASSVPAEVRLYDRLLVEEQPDADEGFLQHLNPRSLVVAKGARVEPAVARAPAQTSFQFLRQGYFVADPADSRPEALVFNRVIELKSTWATKATTVRPSRRRRVNPKAAQPEALPPVKKPPAPPKSEGQARLPGLAVRFERYQRDLGLPSQVADRLTREASLVGFFEAAIAAHPRAESVANWLLNDLSGLLQGKGFESLPFSPAEFGRFVALVDSGRISQAAGKTVLAKLVERGGDPEKVVAELGLQKLSDRAAIEAAVAKVLQSQAAEVARYRAGEKKLIGVFIGATMRETQGAADAATVREVLTEKLA